uniref:Uncharacterized protein n=1 Tax=Romanomermis culicivorax TaxID=13658 RepID=A0A915JJ46_ROMCU
MADGSTPLSFKVRPSIPNSGESCRAVSRLNLGDAKNVWVMITLPRTLEKTPNKTPRKTPWI